MRIRSLLLMPPKMDMTMSWASLPGSIRPPTSGTLRKSLRILRPGGIAVGLGGPPDPAFAKEIRAKPVVRLATTLLSLRTRLDARRRHVRYSFLLMRSSGEQLRRLAELIDAGTIRPVVDRSFPFDETNDAMAYVESGRAKGKVVITMQ